MNIAFRVDASIEIGIGHLMRCLSLAHQINKLPSNIYFICRVIDSQIYNLITEKGYKVFFLPELEEKYNSSQNNTDFINWLMTFWMKDALETIQVVKNDQLDWIIVDHYCIDYRWHAKLKNFSDKLMVIDDLANRKLNCDLLLDQTHGRNYQDYVRLVNSSAKILLGSKFALLRNEFSLSRLKAINRRKYNNSIDNILIFFGGMDYSNLTYEALARLKVIKWQRKTTVNVILNNLAPHLKSVKTLIEKKDPYLVINLVINSNNMADLMMEADLAIGSSGSSAWERCTLGLPTIAVIAAENQKLISKNLLDDGAHIVLNSFEKNQVCLLEQKIDELNKNPSILKTMSDAAFNICDGKGAHLTALKVSPYLAKDKKPIDLISVVYENAKLIFDWQKSPETRKYSINPKIPSWSEHTLWIDKQINNVHSFFWMILHNDIPSGVLRLDPINLGEGNGYLISIFIDPNKYNLGIGRGALEINKYIFKGSKLYAKILPENKKSIALFTAANFKFREELTYYEWK